MSVFQFCLHGLSPGDCTMAIQWLFVFLSERTRTREIKCFFLESAQIPWK